MAEQHDDDTVPHAANSQVEPMVQDDEIVLPFERNQSPGYREERRRREADGSKTWVITTILSLLITQDSFIGLWNSVC